MHKHWWDALVCLVLIVVMWSAMLYGVLNYCGVRRAWIIVVGSLLVNTGCALIGASMILNYLGVA